MAARTIGILVWDGFLTSEVTANVEVLGSAVAQGLLTDTAILLVSPQAKTVTSNEGLRVVVDTTIDRCPPLDALIVPGSAHMGPALEDHAVLEFVGRQGRTVGTLASHCEGAFVLGAAGLLDDRRATTYRGGHVGLRQAVPGALVVEEDLVRDGNLITSSGAVVTYQGALLLLEDLTDASVARTVADGLYLEWLTDVAP